MSNNNIFKALCQQRTHIETSLAQQSDLQNIVSAGTHVAVGHINTDMDREIGAGGVSKLWLLKAGH